MEVFIDDRQDKVKLDDSVYKKIKEAVRESLLLEGRPLNYEISISFVDNEEIRELNKMYRGIDEETDVLSFPLGEDEFINPVPMLGDIIISAEKALEQALEYGHSLLREITYLTVHSMFHLLGYDHMDHREREIMRSKEKQVMKKLNIFK
ncbi:MAG: rRNA maturation RNase YbeY [Tissierellia bacterium]|nr:rRNA maturation RNase YbeY [Tissierellia bacterium]